MRGKFPDLILIYSDSQICDLEWISALRWGDDIEICRDIREYISSQCEKKIAFSAHRLHVMHDVDMQYEEKIRLLSDNSDRVFTIESELHPDHLEIWRKCHRPNVYWAVPGFANDRPDMEDNVIYWGDWFKTTSQLYHNFPDILEDLHALRQKSKIFDALLGSPKPHRKFVADAVAGSGLLDRSIMTYGGDWNDNHFYAKDYFIYEPGTEMVDPGQHIGTMDWARYRGHQCHLSQIIPIQVYNDTYYSVIAETDYVNSITFFSEKTAKPMIAKRLFVAFSGYKFLQGLRKLGFQTFDGIIDEGYDQIPNGPQRWAQAFAQIEFLCQADPAGIVEKIRPIVEHNFDVMMGTDWTKYALDRVQAVIDRDTSSAQA